MAKKKPAAAQFRNRIIEYGVKPADQFTANPSNPRCHPQFQRDVMKSALETVGFVAPVIEARNGYLLDGHERVYQALGNDNAPVPYVVVDVDDDEANYVLATFDPITGLATYDRDILGELLETVNSDDAAVQQMLSQLASKAGLVDFDPFEEWQGMPEFEQDDLTAEYSVRVNFKTLSDLRAFGAVVNQTITENTKSIWYPVREERPHRGKVYVEEP